jgi:predicted nucleotidyltransferase
MNPELEETIKSYFKEHSEVIAVYLFGSHAGGKVHRFSDVDIGVLLDRNDKEFQNVKRNKYMIDLSRMLRKNIHLVFLNSASEELMKQIYSKGKCILANNTHKLARYNMVMTARIADYGYYRNKMQSGFIRKVMEG